MRKSPEPRQRADGSGEAAVPAQRQAGSVTPALGQTAGQAGGQTGGQTGGLSAELVDDVCSVAGTIDFETAPACLDTVSAHIRQHPSLTIDLAGVSRSNSAGLALMIEWLAQARRHGHEVRFRSVPDALRQLADVCQVDALI